RDPGCPRITPGSIRPRPLGFALAKEEHYRKRDRVIDYEEERNRREDLIDRSGHDKKHGNDRRQKQPYGWCSPLVCLSGFSRKETIATHSEYNASCHQLASINCAQHRQNHKRSEDTISVRAEDGLSSFPEGEVAAGDIRNREQDRKR